MASLWTWTNTLTSKISIRHPKTSTDWKLCGKRLLSLRDWQKHPVKTIFQQSDAVPLYSAIIPISEVNTFKLRKGFRNSRWRCRVFFLTGTYTNFPAVPPVILHCPHPIKISISDIFQPLPPKPPKTGVRHTHCCPSLGLLHIGNRQIPKPEQLSVQVILPNWTTAATTFERNCSDSSNSHETRRISRGWSSGRVFYSSRETGLEMMENITKTLWQH